MPPTRTIPPAKAVKTERTHEENQERAYIAASRRSDRSLEARVESARRASEIHKRRTGRSLRVTEQDVINEEMYEEEDDDLPLQYRRLTAHLQTGSADFNRRLAAYLTNQVAMRSAIGHMANGPYGPQYPHPGPYPPGMFPSPMIPQQQHQLPQSPGGTYRQAPYPSPHHPGFRQMHGRAYSMTGPAKTSNPPTPMSSASLDHRRMSTPASMHPGAPAPINTEDARPDFDYVRQTQSATIPHGGYATWQDMGPFTATLPPESQQMLAGAPGFDPNDPMSAMLLHGSESFMSNPYYPWGEMHTGVKGMPVHPSAYAGMSATLAPAALEVTNNESTTATPTTSGPTTVDGSAPSSGLDLGFGTDTKGLGLNVPGVKRDHSPHSLPSGQVTPGEGFWDHFVQDGSWYDDNAALSS